MPFPSENVCDTDDSFQFDFFKRDGLTPMSLVERGNHAKISKFFEEEKYYILQGLFSSFHLPGAHAASSPQHQMTNESAEEKNNHRE